MPSAAVAWMSCGLALLGLLSCTPGSDTGFVEIKTVPSSRPATLYLDSEKLTIKSGDSVLRQSVGTVKLQRDAGNGRLVVLCELVVKKNRITAVTVSVLENPPRCQCSKSVDAPSPSSRICVG